MRWTVADIAEAAQGTVVGDPDVAVDGLSIDTRTLRPGQMFVAVRAERDGHDFVAAAAASGAPAALVERAGRDAGGLALVVVGDTAEALLAVGRAARDRIPGPVVGITGSVGKTSTKDMAAAALAAGMPTEASPRSWNNELGVPLTLANAPVDTRAVVVEMGARGPGHIALLCRTARPGIGVVTAVAAAHTEMFGDLEGVARAKGELVEALPASGTAVLNGDDHRVAAMAARTSARVVNYSVEGRGEVVAERIRIDDELRASFTVRSPWGSAAVVLEARGAHQVGNALAALSIAGVAGVDLAAAAAALRTAALSPWRMEVARTRSGATVVNDAYNANPASMAAALRSLASLPAGRRVAVVGEMAELGADGVDAHLRIADLASSLGVALVAYRTPDYGIEPVTGIEAAVEALGPLGPDVAVLVKGSRVAALEEVATRLADC
ncbi:MAG TPA: UDP-N-acetylmuramoyl-tripeptide--D-alanyl-D-alanine ligase [Acidimicrobiales bacterium]|nr:UDP-N-acetylmuramoyl-tripeptide--D-alanyl-D-alanine ligase [Acidimicrobiales bacterium]